MINTNVQITLPEKNTGNESFLYLLSESQRGIAIALSRFPTEKMSPGWFSG
jgi:hypothetical protein